ncbi:MAG: polysaccharide deacetylase family protein [Lachnospiraceae bacterium]|nr:polysaccharide deacetylase family protein [Lachnospiraceae bacterium]
MKLRVLLVATVIFCLTGCVSTQEVMKKTKKSSTATQSTQATKTTASTVNDSADVASLPNEKKGWWMKRMDNHEQPEAQNEIDISKYDAFYVDTKNKDKKVMYLTFDCGYDNGYTEKMLDVLKKHKAHAIFFVTQTYIRDNVNIVKRMKKEGHLVGNHTVKHKSMPDLSERDIKEELITCADYCKEATGYEMDPYVRPPSGEYSERTLQICKNLGYKTVFWSMAYLDYDVNNQPGADFVIEHFNKYYHNGAIPLIHNVSKSNAEALDTVLTNLEEKGFSFPNIDKIKME